MHLRSRIHEHFTPESLIAIQKICDDVLISDNNKKADKVIQVLQSFNIDFVELGPGTNRLAILIDNYVVKIALDKWGIRDNWNEFSMSMELQPFVIKVYNCNGLLIVTEYVTVISREEFNAKKADILEILSILAESYLLGDVGFIPKNFMNWGYRDNGDLVILDFAYIYRVKGFEMQCSCGGIYIYDEVFHSLICPKCKKKQQFTDIRRKVSSEDELSAIEMTKQLTKKLNEPVVYYKESTEEQSDNDNISEEENTMGKKDKIRFFNTEEEPMDAYLAALQSLEADIDAPSIIPVTTGCGEDVQTTNAVLFEDVNSVEQIGCNLEYHGVTDMFETPPACQKIQLSSYYGSIGGVNIPAPMSKEALEKMTSFNGTEQTICQTIPEYLEGIQTLTGGSTPDNSFGCPGVSGAFDSDEEDTGDNDSAIDEIIECDCIIDVEGFNTDDVTPDVDEANDTPENESEQAINMMSVKFPEPTVNKTSSVRVLSTPECEDAQPTAEESTASEDNCGAPIDDDDGDEDIFNQINNRLNN